MKRAQIAQTIFQAAHVGRVQRTQIENNSRAFRNDICARAAFDDACVDGDAAARIVPFFDARELPRQFVNGVDAFLWRETGVRGPAMYDQFGFTDPFARRLQQAARTEGRLEGLTADFLVGSPEEDEPFAKRYFHLPKRLQGEECLNDSGLHVKGARAVGFAGGNAEGHFLQRSAGIDGVVMAEDQELARNARFARRMSDAKNIATMPLRNAFHARAVLTPFASDNATASIGGGFFQAG